jgi:type I restriction enzyme S subunit
LKLQNKIVAILDKASALIEKRENTIQLLFELLRATFLNMFGDPISNNKNWDTEELKDIAKLERGRFSPRPRNDPSYFGGKYPFIQTGDINNSRYRLSVFTQTLNEKGIKVSKQFKVGDIVIAIVGATIGATSILQINAYATDSIIAIKSAEKTDNVFLEMHLRFYRQFLLDTAPEAARANINLSILGRLKIIIPPIELQNKYLEIDKRIESETTKLLYSLELLMQLQKSLVQKVFNGQLNFNIDFELDALIREIDLKMKENDLSKIAGDIAYLQRLVDKLNNQEFKEKDLYDKAKHMVFQLMAVKEEERKVIQKYDKDNIKLALK